LVYVSLQRRHEDLGAVALKLDLVCSTIASVVSHEGRSWLFISVLTVG